VETLVCPGPVEVMYPGFREVALVDVHAYAPFRRSWQVEAPHRRPDRSAARQVLVWNSTMILNGAVGPQARSQLWDRNLNLRPLDLQDVGVGVFADQRLSGNRGWRLATCGLPGCAHDVRSPSRDVLLGTPPDNVDQVNIRSVCRPGSDPPAHDLCLDQRSTV
jgi:hypothetical protein